MSGEERDPTHEPDGIVFDGRRIRVRVETLDDAIGGVRRFEIVESAAAAAVVPILMREADGAPLVVLVEQERPAVGARTVEIPAGVVAAGENPTETARRELREETGYDAARITPLGTIYSSPGFTNETLYLFLARGLTRASESQGALDSSEIAGVRVVPLDEAVAQAESGALRDAKTVAGLLLARDALRRAAGADSKGVSGVTFDPTSVPQSMLGGADAGPSRGVLSSGELSLENILTQEFNYASVTAYQAMEDRARIFNLYLLLVGVLASALTAVYQLGGHQYAGPVTGLLLFLAGFLGVVFFTQIVQLRLGYRDSLLTMNRIKEYYLKHLIPQVPDAAVAFHWRLRSIPRGERLGSVTYWVALTIAVIGSLCFAGAFVVAAQIAQEQQWVGAQPAWVVFGLAVCVLLFSVLMNTLYYRRKLSKKADERVLAIEKAIIGPSASE